MKAGITLQEMAQELTRQQNAKRDFIVPAPKLVMDRDAFLKLLSDEHDAETFDMTQNFHRQVGTSLGIPAKYYDLMREKAPGLLTANVNTWFAQRDSRHMVRTLDGAARAFLSDSYRRIDNYEVAMAVLPILSDLGDVSFESMQITESRMYIKVVNPRLEAEVTPGDIVQAGVLISNSETGQGSVHVRPLVLRLVCSNGMVINDMGQRKYHIGRASMDNWEMFSAQTLEADDRAFMLKLQDVVRTATEEARFAQVMDKLREAAGIKLTGRLQDVVELTGRQFSLGTGEQESILNHLSRGGDFSLYGLSNAVTRAAQDVESYDRSTELEVIGWEIASMNPQMWRRINAAAPAASVA